jgi:hypothetical protein
MFTASAGTIPAATPLAIDGMPCASDMGRNLTAAMMTGHDT